VFEAGAAANAASQYVGDLNDLTKNTASFRRSVLLVGGLAATQTRPTSSESPASRYSSAGMRIRPNFIAKPCVPPLVSAL